MALVIEDGTGRSDAQVVASVADLNAYFAARGYESLDTETAEPALVRGWSYIENTFRGRWKGRRSLELQALSWPRYGLEDQDGYVIWPNVIPLLIKQANCEAAKLFVDQVDLTASASTTAEPRLKRRAAGGSSEEYEYAATTVLPSRPDRLQDLDLLLLTFLTSVPGASLTNVPIVRG